MLLFVCVAARCVSSCNSLKVLMLNCLFDLSFLFLNHACLDFNLANCTWESLFPQSDDIRFSPVFWKARGWEGTLVSFKKYVFISLSVFQLGMRAATIFNVFFPPNVHGLTAAINGGWLNVLHKSKIIQIKTLHSSSLIIFKLFKEAGGGADK